MKILLIGASSLIGKNIIKYFPKKKIYSLYNKNKPKIKKANVKYKKLNLTSVNEIKKFKDYDFDGIIDCGWIGVYGSLRNNKIQKKNRLYTINLIKLINKILIKNKIKFFISFGSQAEYGPKLNPISERTQLNPKTLYGREKNTKCKILSKFCTNNNIRFVWLRIFSCYGDYEKKDWLIPYTIRNMLLNKTLKFTTGNQKWDYLHVRDIVAATFISCVNKKVSGIFNLSSNKSTKVKSIIIKLKKFTNYKKKLKFGELGYRKDQIIFLQGINKKLKKHNWKPRISLNKGLKLTVSIFKKKLIKK